MTYYIIGNATKEPWLLRFEPYKSVERAKRAIEWQRIGQGEFDPPEYWRIVNRGELLEILPRLSRSPYTVEAWERFLSEFRAEPIE